MICQKSVISKEVNIHTKNSNDRIMPGECEVIDNANDEDLLSKNIIKKVNFHQIDDLNKKVYHSNVKAKNS